MATFYVYYKLRTTVEADDWNHAAVKATVKRDELEKQTKEVITLDVVIEKK